MGQQPSRETSTSQIKEDKRPSQDSSDDSYATRLAESFYDDDSDSQGRQFNSPVLTTLGDLDTPPQLSDASPRPQFPKPPPSRVAPLPPSNNITATPQNETVVQSVDHDLEEGVAVKTSRGTRPSRRAAFHTTTRPRHSAYNNSVASTLQSAQRHETRILPSGLKPPRPQPRIAPLPPLDSDSPDSTPPDSPLRCSGDSFATPKEAMFSVSERTPPAPTPPLTPGHQNDEEAGRQNVAVSGRKPHRNELSSRAAMLLGFGLTALVGPFSILVPILWPEFRQRKTLASFSVGVLSALVSWLAFSIVLALVLVRQ